MNHTYAKRASAGMCISCGRLQPEQGKVRCSECAEEHRRKDKEMADNRRTKGLCPCCGSKDVQPGRRRCAVCLEHGRVRQRIAGPKHSKKLKDTVFSAYGGYVCKCCGETEPLVLTIDHVHGGGCQHEKTLGGLGTKLYRWLISHGFPPGFQVLCFNCNVGKYRNKGVCPVHGNALT